ncbi:MAG: YdbH domain-containing protein [Opitutales bacterium]
MFLLLKVRGFFKFLLYLGLWLLLLVGLGAFTFPWWGPAAFERGLEKVLRDYGFSEAEVSVERIGLKQMVLGLDHLRYEEATLSGATLTLGYELQGLLAGELEYLILAHPEVVADFSGGWPPLPSSGEGRELPDGGRLPGRFPVKELSIEAAVLTLQGVDWAHTVRLDLTMSGRFPDSLHGAVGISAGRMTWSNGGGVLSGLEGEFELASFQPLASKGMQTLEFASMAQGEFTTGPGQLSLSYLESREGESPLKMQITTTALGGKVRMQVDGRIRKPLGLRVRVFLDAVDLEEVATLFPQFDGQIEGRASGELAFAFEGEQIALLPGGLQLEAGTSGHFAYLRQGWLTQDPKLNPEAFVGDRPILEIMKDSRGAPALTELAMRDLKMTAFNFKIQQEETGEQSMLAQIKGERSIKGVTVPVVLDVPIRGDIKETINAVFQFNTRMRD